VSNRILDVLAAGSVVVSDRVTGLQELVGDLVPSYTNAVELEKAVRGLLDDGDRRREIAGEATRLVANHHTFDKRAEQLVALLKPKLGSRLKDVEGNRFGW
jgi:spore maturation protein CgeB